MSEIQGTAELHAALAVAQGSFAPIVRDKTVTVTMKSGGKYTFSYAPLESILKAVAPALSQNGLALTQAMIVIEGKDYVETTLRHSSGQHVSNAIPLFVRDDGPQAYGSALTYARRYGVTLLLCISADDDDDGNAAEGNQATTHVRTPLNPRDGLRDVPPSRVEPWLKKIADLMQLEPGVRALKIFEIHEELCSDEDLYVAVGDALTERGIASKAVWKQMVSMGKAKTANA